MPEFQPPAREAWLALVAKVLKGADFEKRLVSRTADGLAIQPLYGRADAVEGAGAVVRTAYFPVDGISANGTPRPMPRSPTRRSWRT